MADKNNSPSAVSPSSSTSCDQLSADQLRQRGIAVGSKNGDDGRLESLEQRVAELTSSLEQERAKNFRGLQATKTKQDVVAAESNMELASQSRKMNQLRVEMQEKISSAEAETERKVIEQVTRRCGALYTKISTIYAKHLDNDISKQNGQIYERLHETVTSALKDQALQGQGELYNEISNQVRLEMSREHMKEAQENRFRLAEAEQEFFERYSKVTKESKEQLHRHHESLHQKTESLLSGQETDFADRLGKEITHVNLEWIERHAKLEQRLVNSEVEHGDAMRHATEQANVELKKLAAADKEKAEQVGRIHTEEIDTIHKKSIEDIASATANAVAREQIKYESLEFKHARDIERMELLRVETLTHHQSEVKRMHTQIDKERETWHQQQDQARSQLAQELETVTEKLRDQVLQSSQDHTRQTVAALHAQAKQEQAKLDYSNLAVAKAQEAALAEYQHMLEQQKLLWRREHQERTRRALEQIKTTHALEMREIQEKLDASQDIHQSDVCKWVKRYAVLQEKHLFDLTTHTALNKCTFDAHLQEMQKTHETAIQDLKVQLLEQTETSSSLCVELDTRTANVRNESRAWALNYARTTQAKFNGRLKAIETYYLEEISRLQALHNASVEREAKLCDEHAKTVVARTRLQETSLDKEQQAKQDRVERINRQSIQTAELRKEKMRLAGLWQVDHVPLADCVPFLARVLAHAPYSEQILGLVRQEIASMAAREPIICLAAEREKILTQIANVHRFAHDRAVVVKLDGVAQQLNGRNDSSIAAAASEANVRDVLVSKLGMLDRELMIVLDGYEEVFDVSKHPVMYRGVLLRKRLEDDRKRVPEVHQAAAAVAVDRNAVAQFADSGSPMC